jgi:hypothetical protein
MDFQKPYPNRPRQGWLVVNVEDGNLVLRTRLPLRWVLLLICLWATVSRHPSVVDLLLRLADAW